MKPVILINASLLKGSGIGWKGMRGEGGEGGEGRGGEGREGRGEGDGIVTYLLACCGGLLLEMKFFHSMLTVTNKADMVDFIKLSRIIKIYFICSGSPFQTKYQIPIEDISNVRILPTMPYFLHA